MARNGKLVFVEEVVLNALLIVFVAVEIVVLQMI